MDFEDIFEQDHKRNRHSQTHYHGHDNHYPEYHSVGRNNDIKQIIVEKLKADPRLRLLVIIGGILLLLAILIVVILLFPLIVKLFQFISQNGIQGLLEAIWKGKN